MPTTRSHQPFQEPKPSATPHERRKFVVLVVLGCIVVFLIWIWTLPFNFRKVEDGPAGPRQFFNVLGDQVSATLQAYQQAGNTDTAAPTTTDTGNSNTDSAAPNTTTNGSATDAAATDATSETTSPTQPTNQ